MSGKFAIYVTKLKKDRKDNGVKIGVSKNVPKRIKSKKIKSFDFAEPYGLVEVFYANKKLSLKIETSIKKHFCRFRLKSNSNTQEVFERKVERNILWAIRQSLAYPERVEEISWRAANSSLCISNAPEIEIFNSSMTKWDFCQVPSVCNHINSILGDRLIKAEVFSSRLDSGYAANITVVDSPNHVVLSYIFEFLIDDNHETGRPAHWRIYGPETNYCLAFSPSDRIDIETINSQPIRISGSDERAVRYTETYDKEDRSWSYMVSGVFGVALDHEVEQNFLQATLFLA